LPLNPGTLGPALVVASGTTDPIGTAAWIVIAANICAWTISTCTLNPLGGTPLIAVGPLVTGTGAIVPGPAPVLGVTLAASAGSVDAAGIEKWTAVATEYARWLATFGCNPLGLVAWVGPIPPVGAVAGTCLLAPVGKPDFATAIGLTDAAGRAYWGAVADAVAVAVALGTITPAMTNPVGGPLTGVGTIT
jgi:hypothetical protein